MSETEQWRPIPGCEGYYEVSDQGRLRSLRRTLPNGRTVGGRILCTSSIDGGGYICNRLGDGMGGGRTWKRHALVLSAFVGPRPSGAVGRHLNGNRMDNRLANLAWGTSSQNQRDTVEHGMHAKSNRTHCPRGHTLGMPNNVASEEQKNHRACLACARAFAYVHRHPGADLAAVADRYYAAIMGWTTSGSSRPA